MEFRILGPLEVVDDGRPVSIRRGKEQALLAYLLLQANEVVPSDQLIDALWDERPPPTAAKILQNAVSHLRKELGENRLLTRDSGYVLRVEKGELDMQRFEQLVKEGRGDEALALWRGTPLLGLRDERFADDARRRLEEQRLAVFEDRVEADLAAGRHAELIPQVEQLVRENPLRERLQGQLMRALYGAGRQADALDSYRQARKTLSEELGLEPGPELQELERRILRHDPELNPPARPRRRRPETRRRFGLIGVVAGLALVGAVIGGAVYASRGTDSPPVVTPNSLAVVDPAKNRLVDVVPLGNTPGGVAVGRDAVWAANAGDGTVTRIDLQTLKEVQTLGIGEAATDLIEVAGSVWVATGNDNSLVRIDARSGGKIERLALSRDRASAAYSLTAGGKVIWVSSGNNLIEIDAHTGAIVSRWHGPAGINDMAVIAGSLWLVNSAEQVVRLSARKPDRASVTTLGVIGTSIAVGYGSVWVAAEAPYGPQMALWRLEPTTNRLMQTIPFGTSRPGYPPTLAVALGGGSVWVATFDDGNLVRVNPYTGTVLKTIHLGGHPSGVAFGANRVWVTVS
jgi:DNA-binding SARP family transcriptional activator/streptogramin lyase